MKLKNLPVYLIVILFVSCTVYKEFQIEVYNPGEAAIPPHAKKAAVIYRNFKYTEDTLQHYYKNDFQLFKAGNDPKNLDSILVIECLEKFAGTLKANNVFDEIFIFPDNIFDRHSENHLADLPPELIAKLTALSGTDLLIVLETFSSFFSAYTHSFNSPESSEVISVAVWGIYEPERKSIIERKSMIDTVFWNSFDVQGKIIKGYSSPPRMDALKIAAALAGESYGKRFFADWQTAGRMYSVPPLPEFSEAANLFEQGKVDRAINLWEKYAGNNNGKMAINARYNLALAYELKDDLDTAQKWLNSAHLLAQEYNSKKDMDIILLYKRILNERQKKLLRFNN